MPKQKEISDQNEVSVPAESDGSIASDLKLTDESVESSVADPSTDQGSSSEQEERMYIAIARVQGRLVGEGEKLFVVVDSDNTRFPVSGVRPGKVSIKLILMSPEERKGLISFWPRSNGSVIVASLISPEVHAQSPHDPQPDEMRLSGKVKSCHPDRFTVQIRKNRGNGRGNHKFVGTVVTVSSSPPSSIQAGQWVDLKLQRSGNQWLLPEEPHIEKP